MTYYEKAAEVTGRTAVATAIGTGIEGAMKLTINDVAVVVGILGTIFMCLLSWYYKHKHFALAAEIARAGLKRVEGLEDDA